MKNNFLSVYLMHVFNVFEYTNINFKSYFNLN